MSLIFFFLLLNNFLSAAKTTNALTRVVSTVKILIYDITTPYTRKKKKPFNNISIFSAKRNVLLQCVLFKYLHWFINILLYPYNINFTNCIRFYFDARLQIMYLVIGNIYNYRLNIILI